MVEAEALKRRQPTRGARLWAFVQRKWFWLPLVVITMVSTSGLSWRLYWFHEQTTLLTRVKGRLHWEHEQAGPDWVRRIFGYPTRLSGPSGRIMLGPLDRVTSFSAIQGAHIDVKTLQRIQSAFPDVRFLDLSYSQVTDDWFPTISAMRNLESVTLAHTRICGRGFATLASLPRLQHVGCTYCPLQDKFLLRLAGAKSLKMLNLTFCRHLTVDGIEEFLRSQPDCHLHMYGMGGILTQLKKRGYLVGNTGVSVPKR